MTPTTTNPIVREAAEALAHDLCDGPPPLLAVLAARAGLADEPVAVALGYWQQPVTTAAAAYLCGEVVVELVGNPGSSLAQAIRARLLRVVPPSLAALGCDDHWEPNAWGQAHRTYCRQVGEGLGAAVDPDDLTDTVTALAERLEVLGERLERDVLELTAQKC